MSSASRHFFERRLLTRWQAERVVEALEGRLEWSSLDVIERAAYVAGRRDAAVAVERLTDRRRTEDFMLLYHKRNAAVVERLMCPAVCRVPLVANRLLAHCFTLMREEDGEVLATRERLLRDLGVSSRSLSLALKALVDVGALIRVREVEPGKKGRGYARYFVNPKLATYLSEPYRSAAQASSPDVGSAARPAVLEVIGGTEHKPRRRAAVASVVPL